MGYSKEVIDLCNKIYEKHKEALDLIYENIERESGVVTDFENWGNEWIQSNTVISYECDKRKMYFRTTALEELFPTVRIDGVGKWVCYYTVANIPFPTRIYIEFGSQWLDESTKEKFQQIKPIFNDKSLKDSWQWHRLKTWKLSNYNPDETDDFSEISESLKAELERIINNEIPKFEAEVKRILKQQN